MNKKSKYYTVLTGDIIGSSRIGDEREKLLNSLKRNFDEIISELPEAIEKSFEIFRGDSFQCVIRQTGKSLLIGILIRAKLRSLTFTNPAKKMTKNKLDARIALGIGEVGFKTDKVIESDGEAFNFSGKLLDEMIKSEQNIKIKTPWMNLNEELETECYFIDTIINKWTTEQAEAIYFKLLKNMTQQSLAEKLKISQPAVRKRLMGGNLKSIELFIARFEKLMASY